MRHLLVAAACAAALSLPSIPALAQTVVDASLIGLTEAELQARLPQLQRARRPIPVPRGLRGVWLLPVTPFAGLPFEAAFFLREQRLARIELRWAGTSPGCRDPASFSGLADSLSASYGPGVRASDPPDREVLRQSAAWEAQQLRVRLNHAMSPRECLLALVMEEAAARDASEL